MYIANFSLSLGNRKIQMQLHQLGPFELLEVLSWLTGNEICKIWMCGSKSLNERLVSSGGARNLDIVLPVDFREHVWPSLINEFPNLDSLSIEDLGYKYVGAFTHRNLLSLPSRPTFLKLAGNLVANVFIDAFLADPMRYDNMTSLSLLSKEDMSYPYTGLVDWPPNLTFLEVSVPSTPLDLRKLPHALTYLGGSFGSLLKDEQFYPFPVSLTTIDVDFHHDFPLSVLERLPQGTTTLTSLHINCGIDNDISARRLLPSLVCDDVNAIFRFLPQSLTSLRLKLDPGLQIPLNMLPKGLVHARGIFTSQVFDNRSLAQLPRLSQILFLELHC